jgi:glucans biosynthesis protein
MIRREVLQGLGALALWPGMARAAGGVAFSWEMLDALARDVAAKPYARRPLVPQEWRELTYDQYRAIRFDTARVFWTGTGSTLEFDLFPPGLYFPHSVEVNMVEDGIARRVPFDMSLYETHEIVPDDLPVDDRLGYSGVRLRAEIAKPGVFQEYAVFQGASYLRMVPRDLVYGLSARGLAVNTAAPEGEEFPDFTRFWIEKPAPGAQRHRIHALMESPSVTGMYHFTVDPYGDSVDVDVRCTLWPRNELANVGIAPLTSMFYFDATMRDRVNDFRPAVHDSDGLTILNGNGEMLWRPLSNPRRLQVSSFVDSNPQGFGLAQRSRRYSDFHDLEAMYHLRPSLWITPAGDWGQGALTLIEIPTDKEIFDNIVAYWRPREPLAAGSEHAFTYKMSWTGEIPEQKPVARVLGTRIGRGFPHNLRQLVTIDFAPHAALPEDYDDLVIHVSSASLETTPGLIQRNPGDVTVAEIRAQLFHEGRAVTEVWLYRWTA